MKFTSQSPFHSLELAPRGSIAERDLWCGVLLRAAYDLAGEIEDRKGASRIRYSARAWFAADDFSIGSLRWICQQLGLDAKAIRHAMIGPHGEEVPDGYVALQRESHHGCLHPEQGPKIVGVYS